MPSLQAFHRSQGKGHCSLYVCNGWKNGHNVNEVVQAAAAEISSPNRTGKGRWGFSTGHRLNCRR
jgi:hypothetical protein